MNHEIPSLRPVPPVEPVASPVSLRPDAHVAHQLFRDVMQSPEHPDGYDDGFILGFALPRNERSFTEIAQLWQQYKYSMSAREFFDRYMDLGANNFLEVPDATPGTPIMVYEDFMAGKALRRRIRHDSGVYLGVPYDADAPGTRFPGPFPADNGPTVLGKVARGDLQGALDNVDNDAYLIARFGYPPNMNALPFIGRSQKPVLSYSVESLAQHYGNEVFAHYADTLARYIDFWNAGSEQLANVPLGQYAVHRRAVRMTGGETMYRHWDDTPVDYDTKEGLRTEMLAHDFEEAERVLHGLEGEARRRRYIRHQKSKMASCEDTQDFARKSFAGDTIETIRTIDIVGSDLNANMVHMMLTAAKGFESRNEYAKAQKYSTMARDLAAAINKYMYRDIDNTHGMYGDVLLDGTPTGKLNASMAYPLLVGGIVPYGRAIKVANVWREKLLRPYGFFTSDEETSREQWDWDNTWPSINMWLVEAFTQAAMDAKETGNDPQPLLEIAEMARVGMLEGLNMWYERHHNIPEKINGTNPRELANRGEYGKDLEHVQKGFGMTIGSARKLRGRDLQAELANPQDNSWRRLWFGKTASGLIVSRNFLV